MIHNGTIIVDRPILGSACCEREVETTRQVYITEPTVTELGWLDPTRKLNRTADKLVFGISMLIGVPTLVCCIVGVL